MDTSVQDVTAAFHCVKQAYGADRPLLGSDEIFAPMEEAMRCIEESTDLMADGKRAILDENAQKLFNFPAERQCFGNSAGRDAFASYKEGC